DSTGRCSRRISLLLVRFFPLPFRNGPIGTQHYNPHCPGLQAKKRASSLMREDARFKLSNLDFLVLLVEDLEDLAPTVVIQTALGSGRSLLGLGLRRSHIDHRLGR